MRVLLVSSAHRAGAGSDLTAERLGRLLEREHEVTVIDPYAEGGVPEPPPIAFSCEDHARSASLLAAIEGAFGDRPPDYAEFADYRGQALVPLQARNAGHRSLRGTTVAVRLRGSAELIELHDGGWPSPPRRMVFDLEREALRLADLVVHPGDDALALYRERMPEADLDPATRIRVPFDHGPEPAAREAGAGGPLRILCAGRLERVKGVLELLEACLEAGDPNWQLTIVGGDTQTAPMGQSMRMTMELMAGEDPRVQFLDPIAYEELQERYRQSDLLAVPSLSECWSDVALEAMRAGLPVLATPVGGLREVVADGVSGWHADGPGREPLRRALEPLLADRSEVDRVRTSGAPRARFLKLTDEEEILTAYRNLPPAPQPPKPQKPSLKEGFRGLGGGEPLVTGVVTYFGERETVREAVDSLLAQTHRNLEVIVVNDGSFEGEDRVLFELAEVERVTVLHKPNGGEGEARNFAARLADGKYLAFLDADNTLEPGFVARAVAMIEADPEIAYVTSWLRFFGDEEETRARVGAAGYAPLGNAVRSDDAINSDGDTIALMPRRLFAHDGYSYEEEGVLMADWELYRRLREDGRLGAVIPSLEANYRMRPGSLSNLATGDLHARAWDEALTRRRRRALEKADR